MVDEDSLPNFLPSMYLPPPPSQITHSSLPHFINPTFEWKPESQLLPVSSNYYGHARPPMIPMPTTIRAQELPCSNLVLQRTHTHRDDLLTSYQGGQIY